MNFPGFRQDGTVPHAEVSLRHLDRFARDPKVEQLGGMSRGFEAAEEAFLQEIAAQTGVIEEREQVLDFTDAAVAAREAEHLDDELDALEIPEEATVTSGKNGTTLPPVIQRNLQLEPGTFTVDEQYEEPTEEAIESNHNTAFAEGIQRLFDGDTATRLRNEIAESVATENPQEAKDAAILATIVDKAAVIIDKQVEEPILAVSGINKSLFGRLKDKVRGKYRSPEKLRNPNRRRRIGYAVAAVTVAAIATVGVFSARGGDTESISAGAPEPTAAVGPQTEKAPSGSTTTSEVPTTTSTTTAPDAHVSAEGVPGAVSMTREQYDLMGTKQFKDFATTLRENPNITEEEFGDLVTYAELVEQNQAKS